MAILKFSFKPTICYNIFSFVAFLCAWLLVAVLSLQSQATKITEIVQRPGHQQKMCSSLKEKTINKLMDLTERIEAYSKVSTVQC